MDEAVDIAKGNPEFQYGTTARIEVRPCKNDGRKAQALSILKKPDITVKPGSELNVMGGQEPD